MSARIHRLLMAAGAFFSGLGSIWSIAEVQPLGIPAEVGAICALVAAVAILGATVIRANYPA